MPWVNRLEQELGNLCAALEWWLERGEAEQGLRWGTALSQFFYLHGYLSEGRERLARLLAMPGPAASASPQTAARAKALDAAGRLALFQWDHAVARAFMEQSLALKRELGDERGIASALYDLGMVGQLQGDYRQAEVFLEESLAIWGESGNRGGIAYLLACFAELATAEAQSRRALRLAGAAAALREKHGTPLISSLQARLERTLALVRSAFDGEEAVAAWSEGQAMTLEQAIAYALTVDIETPVVDVQPLRI